MQSVFTVAAQWVQVFWPQQRKTIAWHPRTMLVVIFLIKAIPLRKLFWRQVMLAPRSTDTEKIIILQSHVGIYRDRDHKWLLKSSGEGWQALPMESEQHRFHADHREESITFWWKRSSGHHFNPVINPSINIICSEITKHPVLSVRMQNGVHVINQEVFCPKDLNTINQNFSPILCSHKKRRQQEGQQTNLQDGHLQGS